MLTDKLDTNSIEIARLSKALETKVEQFSCQNFEQNQLGEKLCTAEGNINTLQQDLLHVVPLGTILPWVNKPNIEATHQEDLPEGWQLCDGSVIWRVYGKIWQRLT